MKQTKTAGSSIYSAAVGPSNDKFKQNRVPKVGDRTAFADGREFIFVSVSTAADLAVATGIVDAADSTVLENDCTAASAKATEVIVDLTGATVFGTAVASIAANHLADAFLHTMDATGEGYTYKIKSSTAPDSDLKVTLKLYDGLVAAVDTTTDIAFSAPRFANCGASGADARMPVGILCVAAAANTADEKLYCWAQYKGPCVVLGGLTVGDAVMCAASGAFTERTADVLTETIGTCIIADSEYSVIDLNLNP